MFEFLYKNINKKEQNKSRVIPSHIGIIMDGNGRWAKKRGLPRSAGHTAGANNFRTITKYCSKIGVPYLTVYAFSTENWKRPQNEVSALMSLFKQYLEEALSDFQHENIKVRFIGDVSVLSDDLKELIKKVEECSENNSGMTLNIAINYGARAEILRALKLVIKDVEEGKIRVCDISEETISEKLYTKSQPDIDLMIRPGGEYRVSNFLLWQSAYAEYVISDILWPDFKTSDLDHAIDQYSTRNRRFGGI